MSEILKKHGVTIIESQCSAQYVSGVDQHGYHDPYKSFALLVSLTLALFRSCSLLLHPSLYSMSTHPPYGIPLGTPPSFPGLFVLLSLLLNSNMERPHSNLFPSCSGLFLLQLTCILQLISTASSLPSSSVLTNLPPLTAILAVCHGGGGDRTNYSTLILFLSESLTLPSCSQHLCTSLLSDLF